MITIPMRVSNEPVVIPMEVGSSQQDIGMAIGASYSVSEGGGVPPGGTQGQIIVKQSSADGDVAWRSPATSVEEDNTLPITSAAVYTEVGNINALLATI